MRWKHHLCRRVTSVGELRLNALLENSRQTMANHTFQSSRTEPLDAAISAAAAYRIDGIEIPIDDVTRDSSIMIIDDEQLNIDVAQTYLEDAGYQRVSGTTDSKQAIDAIREHMPDVVLLDIMMPEVSGLDILAAMAADHTLRYVPVIVLTASTDSTTRLESLRLGTSDFLAKPVDPCELLLRLRNVLAAKSHRDHLARYSADLAQQVDTRTQQLATSRERIIQCLARAAEFRDDATGQHVIRVGRYAGILARELGVPEAHALTIEQAAQLHDVGKIGIPDAILSKPAKLTAEEYEFIKRHCEFGLRILQPMLDTESQPDGRLVDSGFTILETAAVIAGTHHEKWDGSGYPTGLAGDAIPLEGRITAVADVYDAISSARPYKDPFPDDKCLNIIVEGRGKHFDPAIVDAFVARYDDILKIKHSLN